MEPILQGSQSPVNPGTKTTRKAADYVYQAATLAAVLLLLLTATV